MARRRTSRAAGEISPAFGVVSRILAGDLQFHFVCRDRGRVTDRGASNWCIPGTACWPAADLADPSDHGSAGLANAVRKLRGRDTIGPVRESNSLGSARVLRRRQSEE